MIDVQMDLPESLYSAILELAERDNVSLNQFIIIAIAEKVSALMTDDYLQERAKRGDRDRFESALSKVADVKPEEHDRL